MIRKGDVFMISRKEVTEDMKCVHCMLSTNRMHRVIGFGVVESATTISWPSWSPKSAQITGKSINTHIHYNTCSAHDLPGFCPSSTQSLSS